MKTRKAKEQTASPPIEWAALRPRVTKKLLADITGRIVENFHPYKVVLFGSYAWGKPDLNSDVDLLVVMDSEETVFQRTRRVGEAAEVRFLPMDVLVRTPAEIKDRLTKGDSFLAEILAKGTVLHERDTV